MLRRAFALLVLFAVAASPAVTSTRVFCRYTGVEITGCDESRIPAEAQLRDEGCCLRRTVQALGTARTTADDPRRFEAPSIAAAIAVVAERIGAALPPVPPDGFVQRGPPVFLTNRALLI